MFKKMIYDYYTHSQTELSDRLKDLEKAVEALEEVPPKDRQDRQKAENRVKQAAESVVKLEPHLAYLWFTARKEEADKNKRKNESKRASECANAVYDAWRKQLKVFPIKDFDFTLDISSIDHLPSFSFMLRITFKLKKPYLSKGESYFYLLDNTMCKEKVFQTPMVTSTSWKGALRAALWRLGYKENHEVTIRLLGNPKESEEQQAGRLHFFPTFFDQIGLEVINPHDRKTGVGERGPIFMECVPKGCKGELLLLYVPFGMFDHSEEMIRKEAAQDLEVLAKGIQAMLTTYGFGAKTSSGYGVAEQRLVDGQLVTRSKKIPLQDLSTLVENVKDVQF